MKTLIWTDETSLDDVLRQAREEDVVVLREGHAAALVMPFGDDDLEWYVRERDPEFLKSIAEARRQIQAGDYIRHDQLKQELGLE